MKASLIFTLIALIILAGSVEAAQVVAYFNKTYVNANGTSNQIKLDYFSQVSNAYVEFNNPTLREVDDFEDGDISDWIGTGLSITTTAYEGSYALNVTGGTTNICYKNLSRTAIVPITIKAYGYNLGNAGKTLVGLIDDAENGYLGGFTPDLDVIRIYRVDAGAFTLLAETTLVVNSSTWYPINLTIYSNGTIELDVAGTKLIATDTNYTTFTRVAVFQAASGVANIFDYIQVIANGTAVNITLSLNGNLVQYIGELNATNPSSGKLPINSTYFISGINWANFTAQSGNFNAILEFDYTLDVPDSVKTSWDDMWVNASFYVPEGTVTSNTTFEFNTSYLGTVYSYRPVVYVNGQQYSNYKVSDYEISGVKYITVHVLDVPTGSVSIAIHTIFTSANITVYVYDELTKTELRNHSILNITLLDPNFNVLKTAQLNTSISGNTTISVVYEGYAYLRVKDANGITRQIWVYVPFANTTTAYVYFPTSNAILIQFNIQDNTGLFKNGDIIIKKYVDREILVEIDRQKITADYVTYHYLIANEPYQVYVTNGQEVRSIGHFSSPVSKTTTLTIGTLTIQPLTYEITYDIAYDAPNGTVVLEYSSGEPASIVKFWVNTTNGTNLYYAESTEQAGSFVYLGKANETYVIHFYVKTANGKEFEITRVVSVGGVQPIRFPLFPAGWPEWLYNLVAVGIIVVVVLLFGEVRADIACVLGAAMAAVLWYWGWLRVTGVVIAVAMIIAAAAVIHRSRRVGV